MAAAPELDRRTRRKRELRARMLEAAATLFDERGVHATRVTEICARADVAEKTFFNHFASKAQLLRALAEEGADLLLADIEEARRTGRDTRDRLTRFFAHVAERALSGGPMHRELLTEFIHAIHESGTESDQARRLHAAFAALVDADHSGDGARTELVMGAYYALMFNWANLDAYPIQQKSRAMGQLLAETVGDRRP